MVTRGVITPKIFKLSLLNFDNLEVSFMKYCKQCECYLPDDYDLDFCPPCLDDMDGVIPDSFKVFEEVKD